MSISKRGWIWFLACFGCVASCAIGMDAGATEPKPTTPTTTATAGATSNADSHSRSGAVAVNGDATARAVGTGGNANAVGGNATAAAEGGRGGSATQHQSAAGGNASNEGNSQATAITTNYEDRHQAPATAAASLYASHNCAYGSSIALSIPVGSIGGGKQTIDPSCDLREFARVIGAFNPSLSLKLLCSAPIVAAVATAEDCKLPEATKPEPPSNPSTDCATVDEKIDRAFRKCQEK